MWLLKFWHRRQHKRQFDAAVVAFLGAATYSTLDGENRERVDTEMLRAFRSSSNTYWMEEKLGQWPMKAQCRARAMARLGLAPIGQGLTWQTIIPKGGFWPELDLFNQFRPYSQATTDAKEFLRNHGVNEIDKDD